MLRNLIEDMLMSATRFVKGVMFIEWLFDTERNVFTRLLVKLSNIIGWILVQLFLISMTGGLYLAWLGFKLIWKTLRHRRNSRRNRRRA